MLTTLPVYILAWWSPGYEWCLVNIFISIQSIDFSLFVCNASSDYTYERPGATANNLIITSSYEDIPGAISEGYWLLCHETDTLERFIVLEVIISLENA